MYVFFKYLLPDSPETVQMLSKGDIVYISLFVDLQTVHVRQINNGTDKFKSFLENFSSCCALGKLLFFCYGIKLCLLYFKIKSHPT